MLLQQISTARVDSAANPEMQAVAIAAITSEAPIFSYAQFYEMPGATDTALKDSSITAGSSRAINAEYTKVDSTIDEASVTLRIVGDKVATDRAYVRRYTTTQAANERIRQLETFSRSLGRYLTDQIINGDNTGTNLHGIKTKATGGQLLAMGTNGATVPLGNSDTNKTAQQFFLEKLDELISLVPGGAQVLFMSRKTISRLTAIAREYITVSNVNDSLGATQVMRTYMDIPILDTRTGKDGTTLVIPNNETKGTSSDCTSIYAVRFGEKTDMSLATNNGLQVYDNGLVGSQYITTLELDVNALYQNDKSIARLEGIRIP